MHTHALKGLDMKSRNEYYSAHTLLLLSECNDYLHVVTSLPQILKYFSAFDNYFLQAQRVRRLVRDDFDRVFRAPNVLTNHSSNFTSSQTSNPNIDVLLHPSAIRTAPLLPLSSPDSSSILSSSSGLDAYVQDVLTVPASLAGLPALSVPACSWVDGWPVGVSVVGQWGCDEFVLRVGEIIEQL
jgi:aspartyl-tRNA(Asn)/glutamyl-tRNA(Gln) amidotransferase subunit A